MPARVPAMIPSLLRRLQLLLRRDRAHADLEDEMRLHLELRAESLRREGLAPDDARLAARRRFGNRTSLEEQSREAWGFGFVDQGRQDLRHAMRRLAQRPGFSLAVVVVLALGVGATTAMFSAVDAAMLRPLPFHEPQQLVTLREVQIPFAVQPGAAPDEHWAIDIIDAAAMDDLFSNVAAYASGGLNLADPDRPRRMNVGVVTASFFHTLGIAPIDGRAFAPDDGQPGAPAVAVISYGLWQSHFGGTPVLGTVIQLGSRSFEVVGVMPRGFSFPGESDVWIPMSVPTSFATFEPFRGWLPSTVIARLAPGLDRDAAMARMRTRWQQFQAAQASGPGQETGLERILDEIEREGALTPLQQQLVGDRRTALLVLLGATGLLLLIACANVTNLLLSHAALRRREMAVREVLGATRGRLVRQLLTESLVLSATGTVVGLALAPLALSAMRAIMPAELAGVAPATVDLRVLTFAAVLALVTGIGFGLWPAVGGTRDAPGEVIKAGGGSGATARGHSRGRRVLIVAEVALTLVLLVGAGLMLRSFRQLTGVNVGLDRAQVGTMELSFVRGMPVSERLRRIDALLARLAAMPGHLASGVVDDLPLRGGGGISLTIEVDDMPESQDRDPSFVRYLAATDGYFRTMGIPLLRGRTFSARDDSLAPPVAVINETMAKTYWPGVDALGRTFRAGAPGDPPLTVIGIVADVRELNLERDAEPQSYRPVRAHPPSRLAIVVRSTAEEHVLLAGMVRAMHDVDPAQAVYNVRMMEEVISASVAPRRTNTLLLSAFAALALVLASVGVFAVISYGLSMRSRELGIRSALGASSSDLVVLICGEMALTVALGLTVGIAAAWALTRLMASLLYEVEAHDPVTFVAVPLVLALVAGAATLWPAMRARRVAPASVLRDDVR